MVHECLVPVGHYLNLQLLLLVLVLNKLKPGPVLGGTLWSVRLGFQAGGERRIPIHDIPLSILLMPCFGMISPGREMASGSLLSTHIGR